MDLAQSQDLLLTYKVFIVSRFLFFCGDSDKKRAKSTNQTFIRGVSMSSTVLFEMHGNGVMRVSDSFALNTPPTFILYLWNLSGEELARLGI